MKKLLYNTAAALTITLALGGTAEAKPSEDERQERVTTLTVQLRELDARDAGHTATTELGTAEAWLKEAQASATKRRKRKAFRQQVARVEAMLVLVEALLDQDEASKIASSANATATEAQAKLDAMIDHAQQLEARQTELEKELAQ